MIRMMPMMRDAPAKIGRPQSRVDHKTEGVVEMLGGREGCVAALGV